MFIIKTLNVLNQNKGTNNKIVHYKQSELISVHDVLQ